MNWTSFRYSSRLALAALLLIPAVPGIVLHAQETPAPVPAEAPAPKPVAPPTDKEVKTAVIACVSGLTSADANKVSQFATTIGLDEDQKLKFNNAMNTYRDALDGIRNDNALDAKQKKAQSAEAHKTMCTTIEGMLNDEQKTKVVGVLKRHAQAQAAAKKAQADEQAKKKKK
ncbi:MAG: hypothetical protein ACAI35_14325 [Candidatus Methylacidiphilales bacterium]|nr:hypothetical protein [Candidatus Methylacidiphilales bacterium]